MHIAFFDLEMLCVFFLTIRRRIAHIFFLQLQTFIFLKRERTRELFLQSGEGHNMKSYPYGEFYYVQFVIFLYQIYLKPLQGFFFKDIKKVVTFFRKYLLCPSCFCLMYSKVDNHKQGEKITCADR